MPVIKDMTKIYVGTTPIQKVYAGTSRVWPGTTPVGKVTAARTDESNTYLIIIQSDLEPFDCETAGSQYAYRLFQPPYGWSAYAAWDGSIEMGTYSGINTTEKKLILKPLGLSTDKYEVRRLYDGAWYSVVIEDKYALDNIVPEAIYSDMIYC